MAVNTAEDRIATLQKERASVARELSAFDADLEKQRAESGRFGEELEMLKAEQHVSAAENARGMERLQKDCWASQDRLQATRQQLEEARAEREKLERWRSCHECNLCVLLYSPLIGNVSLTTPCRGTKDALDEQRARFKAQSRDLAAQIRYLKAKYTRESTFRNGLSLQKRYLLLLVGGMSLK